MYYRKHIKFFVFKKVKDLNEQRVNLFYFKFFTRMTTFLTKFNFLKSYFFVLKNITLATTHRFFGHCCYSIPEVS